MSEKPDPSTIEWISRAANTLTYVFLLHLRFSRECEKCEKGARERKRSMRHRLCFHNRTASATWGLLRVPESSFPEHRLLGFLLLSRPLSFYNEQLLSRLSSFWLVVIPSGRSRSARLTARDFYLLEYIIYAKKESDASLMKWLMRLIDQGRASPRGNSHDWIEHYAEKLRNSSSATRNRGCIAIDTDTKSNSALNANLVFFSIK